MATFDCIILTQAVLRPISLHHHNKLDDGQISEHPPIKRGEFRKQIGLGAIILAATEIERLIEFGYHSSELELELEMPSVWF